MNVKMIIQKLSPGVYQYKYIVDGEWRFSPEDPTCNDENGNINNIIDTTNIERSISLIGQNAGSNKFLAMGSQNNSVNFIQTNNRILNSNGNIQIQPSSQQNIQNQPAAQNNRGVVNPQLQFSVQQQQFYAQLQQQQMYQQQSTVYSQQQQNRNQTAFQQMSNNQQMNPQMSQQYGGYMQQQDLIKQQQNGQTQMLNQSQSGNVMQNQSSNISPMQAMYLRASHNNTFDKQQLQVKAHITQQNQTNFDVAFKNQAPQMPPHLSEVPTIKRRNARQVSMWREKQLRPKSSLKSVFSNSDNNKKNNNDMMIEESSFHSEGNGQQLTLHNTPEDDAEYHSS